MVGNLGVRSKLTNEYYTDIVISCTFEYDKQKLTFVLVIQKQQYTPKVWHILPRYPSIIYQNTYQIRLSLINVS